FSVRAYVVMWASNSADTAITSSPACAHASLGSFDCAAHRAASARRRRRASRIACHACASACASRFAFCSHFGSGLNWTCCGAFVSALPHVPHFGDWPSVVITCRSLLIALSRYGAWLGCGAGHEHAKVSAWRQVHVPPEQRAWMRCGF